MKLNVEQFEVPRCVARRIGEVAGGQATHMAHATECSADFAAVDAYLGETGRLARLGARVAAVKSRAIAPKSDEPNDGVSVRVNSYLDAR
ncbi:hypothetical protein AWB68_00052 [Caballeronia choica]|uniref:Uncharacterized protein n=1 Tax=Caballeronia choica TaxID=326476 RepID=A0A158EW97_9BURK|nr:hypothetical protein AWB68_00052 [Caballeronia choica]